MSFLELTETYDSQATATSSPESASASVPMADVLFDFDAEDEFTFQVKKKAGPQMSNAVGV